MKSPKSSNMPQMKAAFGGWTSRILLTKVTETVVEGFVNKINTIISFYGTIQPLSPRQLMLKPEGERSFTWLQIHCTARSTNLIPNDRVLWNNELFKVMAILNYGLNGYVEYHLVKDYQGPPITGCDTCSS